MAATGTHPVAAASTVLNAVGQADPANCRLATLLLCNQGEAFG